jgi:hypothetical protein
MARIDVSPESFSMVEFDTDEIRAIAERLADTVGFPADLEVRIEIDETVPTGRVRVPSVEPVVIEIEGGAFEDSKRLRRFSAESAARVLGRVLLQVHDPRDPAFGTPPPRDEMSFALRNAWDVYAMGRLGGNGFDTQRQRWLYAFRTRHGFDEATDQAFEQLWGGRGLTWDDIAGLSADAAGEVTPSPAR